MPVVNGQRLLLSTVNCQRPVVAQSLQRLVSAKIIFMKPALLIIFLLSLACTQPKHVTFNPDDQAATSGTLGSAKSTTTLPKATPDTSARKDSLLRRRNLP
jgi:hypothetical protein